MKLLSQEGKAENSFPGIPKMKGNVSTCYVYLQLF